MQPVPDAELNTYDKAIYSVDLETVQPSILNYEMVPHNHNLYLPPQLMGLVARHDPKMTPEALKTHDDSIKAVHLQGTTPTQHKILYNWGVVGTSTEVVPSSFTSIASSCAMVELATSEASSRYRDRCSGARRPGNGRRE